MRLLTCGTAFPVTRSGFVVAGQLANSTLPRRRTAGPHKHRLPPESSPAEGCRQQCQPGVHAGRQW